MLSQLGRTLSDMNVFLGSQAITSGALTRGQLRWNYVAVHPDVYVAKDQKRALLTNAYAAWLWTGRSGIVAGRAAAGLHGVCSIDRATPVELIAGHSRRRQGVIGVIVRSERIDGDEVQTFGALRITTAARTALDLARRLTRDVAVRHLDELARATDVSYADVAELLDRYRGARGCRWPAPHSG